MPTLAELFKACYSPSRSNLDFAAIRLHYTGADSPCRALRARAFTVGLDIYFADGAFAPQTRAGLWLLAHEVAHVVQQTADESTGDGPFPIAKPRTLEERAADAAADAFVAGRQFILEVNGVLPVVQRYMAWEHAMLGDLTTGDLRSGHGDRDERVLLEALGRDPYAAGEEGPETLRLPGSGLVVTLGELNVLPDYLGHPEQIETAPAQFMVPLIQSVRSWSIAELRRSAGEPKARHRLPGALRYTLLRGLAESAEVPAIDRLGKRCGFPPSCQYSSVLARNADHFAPYSWYRWHSFHLKSRELVQLSATASGVDRESLRCQARIYAGYADHFLQDSFAAGHLINKILVMQWYIQWLAEAGISYPHADVLAAMTTARQPLLHGPGHYDLERADTDRIVISGLMADNDHDRQAAYAAYLTMLGSGTVQLGPRIVHGHLNKRSLVVSSTPDGPRFRVFGDHALLASRDGARFASLAATASRRAISELLRYGETTVDSREILDNFPSYVEQDGRLVTLEEWHRTGLRDLCFRELFGRWSTRAMRRVVSAAFSQLGSITAPSGCGTR